MSSDIWVLASNNNHKLAELAVPLAALGKTLKPQSDWQVEDADETGMSFIENAVLKARHAAKLTGKPAIADDSGLMVSALGGEPGIYSARYAGTHGDDAANRQKLLQALAKTETDSREAEFICVLAAVRDEHDSLPIIAIGRWLGVIAEAEKGERGFGYDSIFIPLGYQKTAAELSSEDKQRISHRALAIEQFIKVFDC